MINKAGYEGRNPTWWADRILGQSSYCGYNALKCPKHEPLTSFLIPVEATTQSLYFANILKVHNMISIDLGYRYDHIKYNPEYTPGVTPKIPDDMVKGLFIPMPKEPQLKDFDYNYAKFGEAYKKWKEYLPKNAEENIAYIAQDKTFKKHSYSLGATFESSEFFTSTSKIFKRV